MIQLTIRQAGGANIVSIPKAILNTLNLHVGSTLNLVIEDTKIVLTPSAKTQTLEDLLAHSPREKLKMTSEDQQWLSAEPKGREIG